MTLNDGKAEEVICRLAEAYEKRTYMFKHVHHMNGDAPQHKYIPRGELGAAGERQLSLFSGNGKLLRKKHFPRKVESGSHEHRLFLFFATLMTYHSQSEQGFQQAMVLHAAFNDMFTPKISKMSLKKVQAALDWVGFIYPNEGGRRWKESGLTLFEVFDGEPLRIFQQGNIESILDFKKKNQVLTGYGPKLLSLLAIFYEGFGLIKHVEGSFPADVHIQAQCIANGVIEFKEDEVVVETTGLAEIIRKGFVRLCGVHKISPFNLSHAMWFLGSRICWNCNKRSREQTKIMCPIDQSCRGRINTELYNPRGVWDLRPVKHPLFDGRLENESE